MKKLLLPIFIFLIVTSCATIKVTSDFDKTAPFTGYKTYAFTPEALNLNIDELNRKRVITAVENELSLKGFTKSDNPDVLIDLKISSKTQQTATATGGYGYRWGGGVTSVSYSSYVEGTLFVEMIDAAKKQIVWQGRGTGTVDPDASADKREKNINYSIKQIFTTYPPKLK
jgi:hypothetical protein